MVDLLAYVVPFVLCCLVVAGVVEAVKRSVWLWLETQERAKPLWLRHVWRLAAIGVGGLAGFVGGAVAPDLFWYDGFAVGLGAGLLSTTVVAVIKSRVEKVADE